MPSNQLRQDALYWIDWHCRTLRKSAVSVVEYVGWLDHQPDYETLAEAAIDDTEKALAEAVADLAKAKEAFRALRVVAS